MASASPASGAGSACRTPTGRPPMWTDSDQRKLTRLYVYTTLPLNKILNVLQVSTNTGPGKDSANKKLNAMLDKEPRWLHPKTRTDMQRRMNELEQSPVRQQSPDNVFIRKHANSLSSSASVHSGARGVKDEVGLSPGVQDVPAIGASPAMEGVEWTNPAPQIHLEVPYASIETVAARELPRINTGQDVQEQTRKSRFASKLARRSTVLSSSSTSTTFKGALSEYSSGFIRSVKKVMKRYTMPTHMEMDSSPVADMRPETADSTRGSWLYDEHAPAEKPSAGNLPGDFLSLDTLLISQGVCMPGLAEHDCRACLCHVKVEVDARHFVTESGPSELAQGILSNGIISEAELRARDSFGNTALHLLAARGLVPDYLLRAVQYVPLDDLNAQNNGGQTFLHVLGPEWFLNILVQGSYLHSLLQELHRREFDFYKRDIYGRNFFHILQTNVQDPTTVSVILQSFDRTKYSCRDAFGMTPTCSSTLAPPTGPLRRAQTSFVRDAPQAFEAPTTSPLIRVPSTDLAITRQTQLLKFVCDAQKDARAEDSQGRNGLHCLAACILSKDTLLSRFPENDLAPPSAGGARKRKRGAETTPALKKSDSSHDRLELRERTAANLLDSGVDPNAYDADGNTVLMAFAAQLPEDDDYKVPCRILELLLNGGADVHARNRLGETALHVAVRRGRKLAVRTLVQRGANVFARDGDGRSALDLADLKAVRARDLKSQAHYEACRAWLSGQGRAVQSPTVLQEWGVGPGGPRA